MSEQALLSNQIFCFLSKLDHLMDSILARWDISYIYKNRTVIHKDQNSIYTAMSTPPSSETDYQEYELEQEQLEWSYKRNLAMNQQRSIVTRLGLYNMDQGILHLTRDICEVHLSEVCLCNMYKTISTSYIPDNHPSLQSNKDGHINIV